MFRFEVWLEGNCLREDSGYFEEWEAEEEANDEVNELLDREGYGADGYIADDFEIRVLEDF